MKTHGIAAADCALYLVADAVCVVRVGFAALLRVAATANNWEELVLSLLGALCEMAALLHINGRISKNNDGRYTEKCRHLSTADSRGERGLRQGGCWPTVGVSAVCGRGALPRQYARRRPWCLGNVRSRNGATVLPCCFGRSARSGGGSSDSRWCSLSRRRIRLPPPTLQGDDNGIIGTGYWYWIFSHLHISIVGHTPHSA